MREICVSSTRTHHLALDHVAVAVGFLASGAGGFGGDYAVCGDRVARSFAVAEDFC